MSTIAKFKNIFGNLSEDTPVFIVYDQTDIANNRLYSANADLSKVWRKRRKDGEYYGAYYLSKPDNNDEYQEVNVIIVG